MSGKDIIIEFHPQGSFVKVSAMDPASLTEVSIVGDPARGEPYLKQLVLQKLRYVLAKEGRTKGS